MSEFKLEYDKGLDVLFRLHQNIRNDYLNVENGDFLNDHFATINQMILRKKFNLIAADTGMGKTAFARKLIETDEFTNVVFVAPLEIIVEEISKDLEKHGMFEVHNSMEDLGLIQLHNDKKSIVVCTYHNFVKYIEVIEETDLLIIDESHWIHTYDFAANISSLMLMAIKILRGKCTIIGLSATPELLELAQDWFFIDKFIHISLMNPKIPPKKIIIYPGTGSISNINLVKHYFKNYVNLASDEKVLIVLDGGNPKNPRFNNLLQALGAVVEDKHLSGQKAEGKMDNEDVQCLLKFNSLSDSTQVFLATIWVSNGINIYDENIKHVIVLSDKMSVVKQTAARIRIPNHINLVLFQQYRKVNTPIEYDDLNDYLIARSKNIAYNHAKFANFFRYPVWTQIWDKVMFNPIRVLQHWYNEAEKSVFVNFDSLVGLIQMMYGLNPIIIGQELLQKEMSRKTMLELRTKHGFDKIDKKSLSDKDFIAHFGIEIIDEQEEVVVEREKNLFTKRQIEKMILKNEIDLDNFMIIETRDKNRHIKYMIQEKIS